MDRRMKVRRELAFLIAGLLFLHTPLGAAAGEIDSMDCICETECTQDERNADCPLCGGQDADGIVCGGEPRDEQTGEDKETSEDKKIS